MELTLNRDYTKQGVTGEIWQGDKPLCLTLEKPWRRNCGGISCIPEGRYALRPRFTEEDGWHIEVWPVYGRSCIVIIAYGDSHRYPGSIIPLGDVKGLSAEQSSRTAIIRLKRIVFNAIECDDPVFITIRKKPKHLWKKSFNGRKRPHRNSFGFYAPSALPLQRLALQY